MNASIEPVIHFTNSKTLRLEKGDLTALDVEAVVLYAREDLQLGNGFGSAVKARGGLRIQEELDRIGSLAMGDAVVTSAGSMRMRYLIHACGPKFQEPELEPKLRRCVWAALEAAASQNCRSLAFPPMGAGFYGVPLELSARVMLESIRNFIAHPCSLEELTICVIDGREFHAFQSLLPVA